MISVRFAKLNVAILFIFVFFSLFGVATLPFSSALLFLLLILGGIVSFKNKKLSLSADTLIGWGLCFVFGWIALNWIQGLWVIPSQDDTLNHLGFLEAILNSHLALLGKIDRPGADWFGSSSYHFYPTGSHALTALWIEPFRYLGIEWPQLFRVFQVATLALIPGFLWWSSLRAFPKIPREIRLFIVVAAMTQLVFPLAAFGEGGTSRIFALTIFIPFWFEAFYQKSSFFDGFLWSAIFTPVLLFIHPSLFPLLAVAVCFFPKRTFLGSVFGAFIGALFFYVLMTSAKQEVTDPGFMEALTGNLHHDFYGWFDRLKGPFHYWFSDPLGFGKFLSPKNYFIYAGLLLAATGKIPRKVLLLFAIPFLMASLALSSNDAFQKLGLIFYHSVKRISGLTPLLGFTIACFAATWVFEKVSYRNWIRYLSILLSLIFVSIFIPKSQIEADAVSSLFHAPKRQQVLAWKEALATLGANDLILIDRHEYDSIRFVVPQKVYTIKPECGEVGELSRYCQKRKNLPQELLSSTSSLVTFNGKIWWLPDTAINTSKLKQISIDDHTQLIQIYPNQ